MTDAELAQQDTQKAMQMLRGRLVKRAMDTREQRLSILSSGDHGSYWQLQATGAVANASKARVLAEAEEEGLFETLGDAPDGDPEILSDEVTPALPGDFEFDESDFE